MANTWRILSDKLGGGGGAVNHCNLGIGLQVSNLVGFSDMQYEY